MRDGADDCVKNSVEVMIIFEFGSATGADFDGDDQGQRFVAGVLVEGEGLLDAVVGDAEVAGVEGEHELAFTVAHQRGNHHDIRLGAQGWGLRQRDRRASIGRALRHSSSGEK
jgi:hypothetical protein